MFKYDLIIDPGHGGKDPGGGSNSSWIEKDMVLQISLYQLERFKSLGVNVGITRNKDVTIKPSDRIDMVKQAKVCISNHTNAGGGDGAETIYSIYAKGGLAYEIAEQFKKDGQNIRRVFTRTYPNHSTWDYYYLHRETGATDTTIVEYGFADSKKDDISQIIHFWKYYAEAVVQAYCTIYGIKYVPNDFTYMTNEKWKDIVRKSVGRPDEWIEKIESLIEEGKAQNNIMQYLDNFILKVNSVQ